MCSLWMNKNCLNNFSLVLSPSYFNECEHFISNILKVVKSLKQRFASYFTVNIFMFQWNGLQILMWRSCLLMAKCICVIMILESWCTIPQSKIIENNYWEKAGCRSQRFKDCSVSLGICFRQLELGTGVFLLLLKFGCSNNINKNNNIFFLEMLISRIKCMFWPLL